jgi:small subunit ribosomal protein S18
MSTHFDYKDIVLLRRFLTPHGRIMARRRTRLTATQQHALGAAVKRSRFMGLIPYVEM